MKFEDLNPHGYSTDAKTHCHLLQLFECLEKLEKACGIPFVITSGLRSVANQAALIASGKSTATKSRHLIGAAADVLDAGGEIAAFFTTNPHKLEEIGVWCEDFETIKQLARKQGVKRWAHFQTLPPRSGRRIFIP